MTKTLTMKEMRAELMRVGYDENYLKRLDRDNLEFVCERHGIQVYIKSTDSFTYERLIGYDFGTCVLEDIAMYGSKKQYILRFPNGDYMVADYKEFKKQISGCDYPKY